MVGKRFFIKTMTQVDLAYAMSVFKILIGKFKDIQRVITNFWWGSKIKKRKIHLG